MEPETLARPSRPRLYYGGLVVGKVFALDRTAGVADVHLEVDGAARAVRLRVSGMTARGRRDRLGHGVASERADVRAELERRAGIVFGEWAEGDE